jgi:hypothetical protein
MVTKYALYGPSPPSDISEYPSDDDVFDNLSHFEEMGLDYYEILEKRTKKALLINSIQHTISLYFGTCKQKGNKITTKPLG